MAKKGEKTQMLDDAIKGVQRAIDSQFKSARALAEASGINAPNLTRWLSGAQNPDFNNFSLVLMRLGARLVFPDEPENGEAAALLKENNQLKKKISELEEDLQKYKEYKSKWEGHLEGLQATARAQEEAKLASSVDLPLRKTA